MNRLSFDEIVDLPEPLVQSHVDLTDFPFMPVMVARLKQSRAWLICKRNPSLAFYMLNLWTASWHGRPAASVEDDDLVLSDLAMCNEKLWRKVRGDVLRGWVKCSDGRLYHPVVAEQARQAWAGKEAQRARTEAARVAKEAARRAREDERLAAVARTTIDPKDTVATSVTETATDNVTSSKGQGQGQGQGQGYRFSLRENQTRIAEEAFDRAWRSYPKREGHDPKKPAKDKFVRLILAGVDPDDIIGGIANYARSREGEQPRFTKQMIAFLNQESWKDDHRRPAARAGPAPPGSDGRHEVLAELREARDGKRNHHEEDSREAGDFQPSSVHHLERFP